MEKHTIKELQDSIKDMQEVLDDKDTPQDIKDSIAPSLTNAKKMLSDLVKAQEEQEQAEEAEKKAIKQAKPLLKKSVPAVKRESAAKDVAKKVATKKAAIKKVAVAKKKIEDELPALMALVARTKSLAAYRGKSEPELQADAAKKAKKPGKRISAKGKRYYEHRPNRSDVTAKKYPYLEEGGSISDNDYSINVFGYHTKYFYSAIGAEFENAIEVINKSRHEEGFYFRNTSEALAEMARRMDHIYASIEISKIQPVSKEDLSVALDNALLAAVYNYKSGFLIKPEFIRDAIIDLSSVETKMAKGGMVGRKEVKNFIYDRLRTAGVDIDLFKRKVAQVKMDELYGDVGEEDYEGYITTQEHIADLLQKADLPDTLYYDNESGEVSENEPEESFSEDEYDGMVDTRDYYEVDVLDVLYHYAQGGMINHGFRVGDKVVAIYKGFGIVENDGIIEIINPQIGTRSVPTVDDSKHTGKRTSVKLSIEDQIKLAKETISGGIELDPDEKRYEIGWYGNSFATGGRIKSAINRDRAYESDEDWELKYDRKTKPKHPRYQSLEEGGKVRGSKGKANALSKYLESSSNPPKKLFGGMINIRTPDNLFNAHSGDGSIDF